MKQAALELNLSLKKTCKREFLEQMEQIVPWSALIELIAPYYPEGRTGRPPFSLQTMLRIHFMQQSFQKRRACNQRVLRPGLTASIDPLGPTGCQAARKFLQLHFAAPT